MSAPVRLATFEAANGVDAVEPVPCCGPGVVAIATYSLGDDGLRCGSVVVLRAERDGGVDTIEPVASTPPIAGVLDIRCVAVNDAALVVAACADGCVRAFRVSADLLDENRELPVAWSWCIGNAPDPSGPIALSVDISNDSVSRGADEQTPTPATYTGMVSDSAGGLHCLVFSARGCERTWTVEAAHSDSAWTATLAADYSGVESSCGVAYSGGDDGVLASWDVREDGAFSSAKNSRAHGLVGVTSLVPLPGGPPGTRLLSGGYDDQLVMWDTRCMRQAVSSVDCGGGVWRIKVAPAKRDAIDAERSCRSLLLAACMYDGFKVVTVGHDDSLAVRAAYDEHKSLAYGSAWLAQVSERRPDDPDSEDDSGRRRYAVTGSFYDRAVHVWKI